MYPLALSKEKERTLNGRLMELCLVNFEYFCTIAVVDKTQAYVCLERGKGRSNGAIAKTLGISRQAVASRCKRCGDEG